MHALFAIRDCAAVFNVAQECLLCCERPAAVSTCEPPSTLGSRIGAHGVFLTRWRRKWALSANGAEHCAFVFHHPSALLLIIGGL